MFFGKDTGKWSKKRGKWVRLYAHNNLYYSYNWWLVPDHNAFMAIGKDGQFAYVAPEKQIAITRLGDKTGSLKREDWIKLFVCSNCRCLLRE